MTLALLMAPPSLPPPCTVVVRTYENLGGCSDQNCDDFEDGLDLIEMMGGGVLCIETCDPQNRLDVFPVSFPRFLLSSSSSQASGPLDSADNDLLDRFPPSTRRTLASLTIRVSYHAIFKLN